MSSQIICNHYSYYKDKNMQGVIIPIHENNFRLLKERLERLKENNPERYLGSFEDFSPAYYAFEGQGFFMRNGLLQIGKAETTSTPEGFDMIRTFSRSTKKANRLEWEIGTWPDYSN